MDININSQILVYNDLASFPVTGAAKTLYIADDSEKLYRWNGSAYVEVSTGGGVPYTGATSDVDLGEFELKAGQVTLDITPTGTAAVSTTRWNDTIGVSETTLKGGNVILKNGIDLVARIVNKVTPNTTLTKAAYQAVRISGAQGQRLAVNLAQANNDNNSADTIGLVAETIATNQEGFIITVGQLENINTTGSLQGETWADGDVIYLSPTTAGKLTNIKPSAPQHIVIIGYVEYAHANNGKLYVKVMNGWELEELHNVSSTNYTTPIDTDSVLTYDVTNSIWKRLTLANLRTDVLDGFNTVSLIRQEFTYTSGAQTFTLSDSASAVYSVFVNGQELRQSQYTVVTTTLTIVDTLEASDRVDVIYSNATLGINPSYTKAETDTLLNAKVTSNTAITGATKTKITYDAKGLVTSGADATTSDIADSSNKRYVTDANLVVIGNTSGTNTGDQTFLNPRVQTVTSSASVTPTSGNDLVVITAQAAALTMEIPTGTPVEGQALMVRVKDNGTARGITWTSGAGGYRAIGITLPTTTVISKTTYVGLIYNSTDSTWDAIGVTTEA
jgi:nitrogen fixation protein